MKVKENWLCSGCGATQMKWTGSCTACKEWNTMERFAIPTDKGRRFEGFAPTAKPMRITDVQMTEFQRSPTGLQEVDRLFGGGIVTGSLILLGGDPGIGKSTLMLQLAHSFCKQGKKVLYVSGEESCEQISMRGKRLGIMHDSLYLLAETLFSNIKAQIEQLNPDILIVDSIQIVYKGEIPALPGSVTQVKEVAMECMYIAKGMGITTFVIGHVTKSGELAGPRVLEHIVDVVLEFEGDSDHGYRMLRSNKNRFGPTDEIVMFQMKAEGLEEVSNPSQIFLEERLKEVTGSAIIPTMEGSRAILIEVQALVSASAFPTSSRRATGIDPNRLALLLAVLEKRMGYHFQSLDVFVSVAGGMKIREPAVDLGIILAIASSFCNRPIDSATVVIGEVGLSGELRTAPRTENRIREALHMGFKRCILPKKSVPKNIKGIQYLAVERVEEVIQEIFS